MRAGQLPTDHAEVPTEVATTRRLRVVLTGASGFLGSHIALSLVAAGHTVIAAVRDPAKAAWLAASGVTFVRADLTDKSSLINALRGADALVSNAALGSNQGSDMAAFERVNCQGVRDLFDAAFEAGVERVIHISSVAVYRTRLYAAMNEETLGYDTDKRSFNWSDATTDWRYARTKTLSEKIAWERAAVHGLALTTLRPGPVYGSRDEKATAKLMAKLRSKRVVWTPTVGVPWVHADDVAVAVTGALANSQSEGRAYNIAGPPVRQSHFMHALGAAMKARGENVGTVIAVPVPVWVRFDTSAAARDLGFVSRPLELGIAETLENAASSTTQ